MFEEWKKDQHDWSTVEYLGEGWSGRDEQWSDNTGPRGRVGALFITCCHFLTLLFTSSELLLLTATIEYFPSPLTFPLS